MKIVCTVIILLFLALSAASPQEAPAQKKFKNYAIGVDTSYTVASLFPGETIGGGIIGEMCFWGDCSAIIDLGYMSSTVNGTLYNKFMSYVGVRFYFTYDALAGPYGGLGAGALTGFYESGGIYGLIFPIEFGWKFIFPEAAGLYLEPDVKVILIPSIDQAWELYSSFYYMIGVNMGFAF